MLGREDERGLPGRIWPWSLATNAVVLGLGLADRGRVAPCAERWACCSQVLNGCCHVAARLQGAALAVCNLGDADCGLREVGMPSVGGASRKLSKGSWRYPNELPNELRPNDCGPNDMIVGTLQRDRHATDGQTKRREGTFVKAPCVAFPHVTCGPHQAFCRPNIKVKFHGHGSA